MATREQLNAVVDLHAFNDGSLVQNEYPFSEDGTVEAGKTTYDISHRDPYELYYARRAGGQGVYTFTLSMTVGSPDGGTTLGYKGEPTTTTPFGSVTPDHIGGVKVFAIQARSSVASIIFTDDKGHSLVGQNNIQVSFDGGTVYDYYANSTDSSGTKQYDNTADLSAITADFGNVGAVISVEITVTLDDITNPIL